MPARAYLDHAATTPVRPEAAQAMAAAADRFGNPSGQHAAARAAKTALEEARERLGELLGAAPGEVVFTSGGTEADNLALKGAAWAARDAGRGDGVVVSAIEHKAVQASAQRLEREGARVTTVGATSGGLVDVDALAPALDERTAVVSIMTVNNEVGTIQPVSEIAAVVRERAPQAVFHTDAVQAAPWIDVSVAAGAADLVAISAHKFGGPKGTGALIVRNGVELVPLFDGGGHERGRRAGTNDVVSAVGMAAALDATVASRVAESERISALRDRLRADLLEIPGAWENGDPDHKVAGNLHLGFSGIDAETLLVALDRAGVDAAAGSSCSSGATEPSPVLSAMGLSAAASRASIRLSLGWSTTDADIDLALSVIPAAVERLTPERVR